jgi:hypothetical protein
VLIHKAMNTHPCESERQDNNDSSPTMRPFLPLHEIYKTRFNYWCKCLACKYPWVCKTYHTQDVVGPAGLGRTNLNQKLFSFLSAFTTLRKATVNCVMPVSSSTLLSVCVEQLGSHWTDFHEI